MTLQADSNGNGNSHVEKRGWVKTEQGWEPLDSRMQQIVFWIRANRRVVDIAAEFHISPARVSRIARKIGLPDRRHTRVPNSPTISTHSTQDLG